MRPSRSIWLLPLIAVVLQWASACADDEFENEPISYSNSTPDNCISRLQQELDSGTRSLDYDSKRGYLATVLDALNVPTESQMLVFSKTSLQQQRITPRTPRALYFNDDVYIGYCHNGDVLEVSAVDSQLGTVFYTLSQEEVEKPQFDRHVDNCLVCHSSSRTRGVPGHLVRSLFVNAGGQPIFSAGSRTVTHKTPIEDRWGGWYVTGQHGEQSHLGNLVIRTRRVPEPVDNSQGLNVVDLTERFDVSNYLTPHSDVVALMVMEHQTQVHNYLVKASYSTRQALHHQATMNKALGYPETNSLDSTARRIQSAGDDLVEVLLLSGEAPMTEPITGTSGYAKWLMANGERDKQGRSLRDLDMTRRMFKYPCSYLIYSEAFDNLPPQMLRYVWQRMWDVLSGKDESPQFEHLSPDDRVAIIEIIRDTKQGLPAYWKNTPIATDSGPGPR